MKKEKWANAFESRDDRRAKKRMAVLRAGAYLFNKQGFERTTLDDIAKALNVTKRTLYYYIDSKDEILIECNRHAVETMKEIAEDIRRREGPPLERIERYLRHYMGFLADDMGVCLILSVDLPLEEPYAGIMREGRRKGDMTMRALIEEGIADGSIAPCDPRLTTAAIFGAFNWVPHWNTRPNPAPLNEIADSYIPFVINGLKARPEAKDAETVG